MTWRARWNNNTMPVRLFWHVCSIPMLQQHSWLALMDMVMPIFRLKSKHLSLTQLVVYGRLRMHIAATCWSFTSFLWTDITTEWFLRQLMLCMIHWMSPGWHCQIFITSYSVSIAMASSDHLAHYVWIKTTRNNQTVLAYSNMLELFECIDSTIELLLFRPAWK